ncbi:hypothetical protein GX411_03620 [Candidatus Fermentibacteria bacterium]|nr:hypothetical protein [Candidatus Fermentibacteria bacterium]
MEHPLKTGEESPGGNAGGLRLLFALQMLDSEMDRTRSDLERIPGEMAIADKELVSAREEYAGAEKKLAEIREGQVACEKERSEATARMADYRTRQSSLKTNEEYRAMTAQIEFVRQAIDAIDVRVIELMYAEDEEKAGLEAAKRKLDRSMERVQRKKQLLEQRAEDLERALRDIESRRAALVPDINIRLLRKYEQLRASGKPNAVVQLTRCACGGCLTHVPPQHAVEIEAGTMYNCPICGRFVVSGGEPQNGTQVV